MRHLMPEDVARHSAAPKAPFSMRLPKHLWNQRSFYPLFPSGKDVALDLGRS